MYYKIVASIVKKNINTSFMKSNALRLGQEFIIWLAINICYSIVNLVFYKLK